MFIPEVVLKIGYPILIKISDTRELIIWLSFTL